MRPDAWAKLIKEPKDRREQVGRLLEAAGGQLHGYWYEFSSLSTTVLTTVEKMLERSAGRSASPSPGG